jgi:sugar/nucleoside kinase (ribokinase family)
MRKETEKKFSSGSNMLHDKGIFSSCQGNLRPLIAGTGLISLDVVFLNGDNTGPKYWAGGTCGNVLTILAYLGWRSYPVGIIGKDEAGAQVLQDIKRVGVHIRFLERNDKHQTPIVVEQIRKDVKGMARHRFIWICPNCGSRLPGYRAVPIDRAQFFAEKLPNPEVFFFDRVSRGILHIAETCAAKGALVVFEPSGIKETKLFQEAVSISHIVKYSHQRMGHLKLPTYPIPLLEVETYGETGLRYRLGSGLSTSSQQWAEMQAYVVDSVKDTAGAGDWCTAGILNTLGSNGLKGLKSATEKDIIKALRFGQAFAALKCSYEGARGVMYAFTKKKLEQRVSRILTDKKTPAIQENGERQISEALRCICPKCSKVKDP